MKIHAAKKEAVSGLTNSLLPDCVHVVIVPEPASHLLSLYGPDTDLFVGGHPGS